MSLSARDILESPNYYPLRFDGENLLFVRMSRSSYQQSIFTLPNRIVRDGDSTWTVPFAELMDLVERSDQALEPPVFIFQIAHCGSTLLSQALDQPGDSLVIREPFTLRQFASMPAAEDAAGKNTRRRVLATLLYLYSRRYDMNEQVLIKANVPVNYALNEILELVAETKGILLYSEFEDYLLGVLKSHKRRMWAIHVVREAAARIRALKGFADVDFESLIPAQATAVLWLSQLNCYRAALENRSGSTKPGLRTLNSSQLFQQPASTLQAAKTHLGINMSTADIERVVNSDLFKRHAKNPEQPFSEEQRLEGLRKLQIRYRDKIDNTLSWCDRSDLDVAATVAGSLSDNSLV